jgi:hypothetical protein
MSPKDKEIIAKKIHNAQVTKKILSTWDLLKDHHRGYKSLKNINW